MTVTVWAQSVSHCTVSVSESLLLSIYLSPSVTEFTQFTQTVTLMTHTHSHTHSSHSHCLTRLTQWLSVSVTHCQCQVESLPAYTCHYYRTNITYAGDCGELAPIRIAKTDGHTYLANASIQAKSKMSGKARHESSCQAKSSRRWPENSIVH